MMAQTSKSHAANSFEIGRWRGLRFRQREGARGPIKARTFETHGGAKPLKAAQAALSETADADASSARITCSGSQWSYKTALVLTADFFCAPDRSCSCFRGISGAASRDSSKKARIEALSLSFSSRESTAEEPPDPGAFALLSCFDARDDAALAVGRRRASM